MKPTARLHAGGDNPDRAAAKSDRLFVIWLEEQSDPAHLAWEKLDELHKNACQPRHTSGNACIKLCYFLEQCRKSKVLAIRKVALSERTCLDLFNFYIDWTEKNQHRSMRQVLELLASLVALNDERSADSIKAAILQRLLSIITHQGALPLVKPALKSLESLMAKGTITTGDLIYWWEEKARLRLPQDAELDTELSWDSFISAVFEWIIFADVSPAAGKLLVTLFGKLRDEEEKSHSFKVNHTVLWQRWIRNGLAKNPTALENVKNHLFPTLFKSDRPGSLLFLEDLNNRGPLSDLKTRDTGAQWLLHLAAIEVGKKLGLVEDPSTAQFQKDSKKSMKCVVLAEASIGDLMTHSLETVRSLAFSVLVSSSSTTRPYSVITLNLLRSNIAILYADTDAKFRNEILGNTRHMIERCRGAIAFLTRELENIRIIIQNDDSMKSSTKENNLWSLNDIIALLEIHKGYIAWFVDFLCGELIPTASYQRHITGLKAVGLLLRSGIPGHSPKQSIVKASVNSAMWPYAIVFFKPGVMRLLLDLLMDPFEDVRMNAGTVLKYASQEDFNVKSALANDGRVGSILSSMHAGDSSKVNEPRLLSDLIERGQAFSQRTGRADYADGLARSYDVLYGLIHHMESRYTLIEGLVEQLEIKVEICEDDLAQAVLEAPIHGAFASLNYVWDSVDNDPAAKKLLAVQKDDRERLDRLQFRMLDCCQRLWNVVKDVLCNDSPEGHLPQAIDEVDEIDTKDVLSYSFRAIHESSNLMFNIVGKIKSSWIDGLPILPLEVFSGIGNLTFEQLSTLRHRGAFSTVSLTFAECCQLTQYPTTPDTNHKVLLENWYQGALRCIMEQASTTRRSAGIPALITGVLSSDAQAPAFEEVMEELKVLAEKPVKLTKSDETKLSQVHAMNCLKEIFKSSLLGKRAESHIADCLQIASDSLNSEIWAIRNCGLLLLRSLIDSLFGTNESKVITEAGWDGRSIKLSYDKYPALPELLLKLLDTNSGNPGQTLGAKFSSVESMFPALDIIRRAGPPNSNRHEIFESVSVHLGSKVWHVRELAARTICTLLLHEDWLSKIVELLETSTNTTNRLHGILMALKFVLERRLLLKPETVTDGLDQLASLLKGPKMWNLFESGCPETLAAYLEVINTFARILVSVREKQPAIFLSRLGPVMDHLFLHDAYEEFLELMKAYPCITASIAGSEFSVSTALACNAIAVRSVFTSSLRNDTTGLQNIIRFAATLDSDVAIAAIEAIPDSWSLLAPAETLFGLVKIYMGVIEITQSPDVRSSAIMNLAEVVDRLFARPDSTDSIQQHNEGATKLMPHPSLELNESIRGEIRSLGAQLRDGIRTPALSNAQIRISGSLLVCEYVAEQHFSRTVASCKPQMEAWGKISAEAGTASNDFETRHAAAAALASFYKNPFFEWYMPSDECVLPSIFALYDTLNDDDDEIRNLSAETVSTLLRKSLVPLAARVDLAEYISKLHVRARTFAWSVVSRMTGSKLETVDNVNYRLQPLDTQLSRAMEDDDSLFVQEEQNLFVDEVREAKLWNRIYEEIGLDTWNSEQAEFAIENTWQQPHTALAVWVMEGLMALNVLLKDDGPLGWTSKPAVFALISRLLLSANAIIKRHEGLIISATGHPVPENRIIGGIIFALQQFTTLGKDNRIHESLLHEVQKNPSPLASLPRIVPDDAALIKKNVLFTTTSRS